MCCILIDCYRSIWGIYFNSRIIVVAHVNRKLSLDRRELSSRRAWTAVPHDLFARIASTLD